MNYKMFLDLLKEDYSNEQLQKFLKRKHIDWKRYGLMSEKQRLYVKEEYIPKLIKQNNRETHKLAELWAKSALMRLAFVRCNQKKVKLTQENAVYYIAVEAIDIINHLDKDDKGQAIKQRFREYCNHVKKGDYDTTDDTII